jgi:hypothetical protein
MSGMKIRNCAVFIALICLPHLAAGQTDREHPRKIDQFTKCRQQEKGCINLEDEWARLDLLAQHLQSDRSTEAYILGYQAEDLLPGNNLAHLNYIRNYVQKRVVDDSRVHLVDAGYRDVLTVELWVGRSCSPPVAVSTAAISDPNFQSAHKFQEFGPRLRKEIPVEFEDDENEASKPSVLMDGFAALLESHPHLRGYIIAYDGAGDRYGTAFKFAETYRTYLYESATLGNNPQVVTNAQSRILSLKGGRRRHRVIELWVVPDSQPAPPLTPDPSKAEKRRRKLR